MLCAQARRGRHSVPLLLPEGSVISGCCHLSWVPLAVPGPVPFPVRLLPNQPLFLCLAWASSATNRCASSGLHAHCFMADPVPCLYLCVLRRRLALRVQWPPQLRLPCLLQGQLGAGQPCGKLPLLPLPPVSSCPRPALLCPLQGTPVFRASMGGRPKTSPRFISGLNKNRIEGNWSTLGYC